MSSQWHCVLRIINVCCSTNIEIYYYISAAQCVSTLILTPELNITLLSKTVAGYRQVVVMMRNIVVPIYKYLYREKSKSVRRTALNYEGI